MQSTVTGPATAAGKYGRLKNFINGGFTAAGSGRSLPVFSPLDGSLLAETPELKPPKGSNAIFVFALPDKR